jgi:methylmalonyl-CoA/ethylmalonyl-CoA epimerase
MQIKELRIILTVENLDEIIRFYREVAGMATSKEWHNEPGNGIILDAGRASLELIDAKHAAVIDDIEVGKRIAGPIRLALRVSEDINTSVETFVEGGATALAKPTKAPWSDVARIEDPAGMQITLFTRSTLESSHISGKLAKSSRCNSIR